MKNNIVACVVTYNRKDKLKNCINALLSQNYKNFDILIVDNASTDGTRASIQKLIDDGKLSYVNTGKNLGGAGGFNYAIKNVAISYKYIWMMDDDTYPMSRALSSLVDKANMLNDQFGFLSSLTKWTDGSVCIMNMQTVKKQIFDNEKALENYMIPVSTASFVSLFFKSEMARKFGLPIKEFFLWGDDTEYTERIGSDGGFLVLDSVVVHDMHENVGVDIVCNEISRVSRYYMAVRNRIYTARKSRSVWRRIKAYISPLKQMCRVLISARDHKGKRLFIIIKGLGSSIRFNPQIEFLQQAECQEERKI